MTVIKLIVIGLPFLAAFAMCGRIFRLWLVAKYDEDLAGFSLDADTSLLKDGRAAAAFFAAIWGVIALVLFLAWLVGAGWAIAYGW